MMFIKFLNFQLIKKYERLTEINRYIDKNHCFKSLNSLEIARQMENKINCQDE